MSGLMAEAGPEATLPLKRGSDGSLAVTMNGSDGTSAGSTVVNSTVNQSGEEKSSTGNDESGKLPANMIKGVVLNVITNEQRPGGVLYK